MRYVIAGRRTGGDYWGFDPGPYLAELDRLAPLLPPGARAFATDPPHYDYAAPDRCTKDLRLESLELGDLGSVGCRMELSYLAPPGTPGVSRLGIEYTGVRSVDLRAVDHGDADEHRLGHLLVDEVRPAPAGVAHEFLFWSGELVIECADLVATWRDV